MKRALFVAMVLLALTAGYYAVGFIGTSEVAYSQGDRVLIHGYGYVTEYIAEDTAGSPTSWVIKAGDIDTSETINIGIYHNVSTMFRMGFLSAAIGDSFAISIHGLVSWNDTNYVLVDSIAACPLVAAELVTPESNDTCAYKIWTLPAAPYFKIVIGGWDTKTAEVTGVLIEVINMKQQ